MSPGALNITDAIFSQAQREPRAIAVIDGDRNLDYAALCRGVGLAAQQFRRAGWKAGDIVGISLRESPLLHLVSALALARMGVTQAPFPAGDPAPLHLSRIKKLGVCGLVADGDFPAAGTSVVTLAHDPGWLAQSADAVAVDDMRAPGGDRVWIIGESSGTTGTPKLIGISHILEDAHGRRQAPVFGYRPGERFLNLTGMRFLTAIKRAIRCLSDGGTLAFAPAGLGANQLMDWIDLHRVTYVSCVPMHLHRLLREIRGDSPRLPALRILRSTGSALPALTLEEVRRRIAPNVYVDYGLNEVSTVVAATPDMLAAHPDTAGRPLEGVELEIVDEKDRPVAAGALGHVRVRGLGIEPTYFHTDTPGQSRMFRNGWCYPGDIGARNEAGLLFIKGRADDIMNFDGILIGPGEIESVLRQHPAVLDVAAFALPSLEHQDIPAAGIVSGNPLRTDELARFCAERLGIRAPRAFFRFDAIPRNAMGKILRRRLIELAMQTVQAQTRSQSEKPC